MASSEAWIDFEQIRHNIKNNTVDRLKQILAGFNDECGTHIAKSGKKQDIIDRICNVMDAWRASLAEDRWIKAKQVIYQVRTSGLYTPARNMPQPGAMPTSSISSHATYDPPKPVHYPSTHAGSSNTTHYDPYNRRPASITTSAASTSSAQNVATGIRFKDSPFFTIDQAITPVVECPESTSPTDRRQQAMTFTLNEQQLEKMKPVRSKYQLRLFCTSSIFYAGNNSFRSNAIPCPMEFPPTCEVRVNGTQITANLKGLKKKPGTAPPPDIGKYAKFTGINKLEMVYVNSQQPVQSKKYYMIIMMVEVTTIDTLIMKLKTEHVRTSAEVRQKMIQAMTDDDEIIAGPQTMSLKCPLTFVRISTPCRSLKCVHPQCFDATSWYTMMEQTTTWLCPVCERTLDHKDLILDGYFDEILRQTPDSVEDVMVEADGQWHTSDNKYGSPEWTASHRVQVKAPSSPVKKQSASPRLSALCPPSNGSGSLPPPSNSNGKARASEVFVLDDSDDSDEGHVEGALTYPSSASNSYDSRALPPQTQSQSQTQSSAVIDLTLDSDDDDEPLASTTYGKRKAPNADLDIAFPDQSWKKGRIDPSRILPAPRMSSSASNGSAPVLHASSVNNHPPASPPPARFSSFAGNTLPPPAPYYSRHGSAATNASLQLPPLTGPNYQSRQSQNTRWS